MPHVGAIGNDHWVFSISHPHQLVDVAAHGGEFVGERSEGLQFSGWQGRQCMQVTAQQRRGISRRRHTAHRCTILERQLIHRPQAHRQARVTTYPIVGARRQHGPRQSPPGNVPRVVSAARTRRGSALAPPLWPPRPVFLPARVTVNSPPETSTVGLIQGRRARTKGVNPSTA